MSTERYQVFRYVPRLDRMRGFFRPSSAERVAEFESLDDARAFLATACDRSAMFLKYPRGVRHGH